MNDLPSIPASQRGSATGLSERLRDIDRELSSIESGLIGATGQGEIDPRAAIDALLNTLHVLRLLLREVAR